MYNINFELWRLMDNWYLFDAACLISNIDPENYPVRNENLLFSGESLNILRVAERTIWRNSDGSVIPNEGINTLVPPRTFLLWAVKKGFSIPKELCSLIPDETIQPVNLTNNELSRQSANKRWAPHKDFLKKAGELAEEKWKAGDEALHNEMADYILGRREFSQLKNKRPSLLKHLKSIAKKYGRVRGLKGSFRNK